MTKNRLHTIGLLAAASVAVLFGCANLLSIPSLWGFNFLSFLPTVWTYLGLVFIALSFLPVVSDSLLSASRAFDSRLSSDRRARAIVAIAVSILAFMLFWLCSVALPLLGDGSLRAREISDGKLWQPTEAGDFLVHALAHTYVLKPRGLDVFQTYRCLSMLAGIGFLIGLFRLFAYLHRPRALFWTLVSLTAGATVFFFGYIESYSIVAALIPWTMLSGVRVADGTGSRATFVLWVIAATAVHSIAAILFGVAVLILLTKDSESAIARILRHRYALPAGAIITAIVIVIGKALNLPLINSFVVPLRASLGQPTALLSGVWLLNLANWVLLSGLAGIGLLAGIAFQGSRATVACRRSLVWALVAPSILFVLLFMPKLGGPIDWDLYAVPISLIILSLIVIVESAESVVISRAIVPIVAVAMVNIAGFVAVNASVTVSADRFSKIIPLAGSPNPWIHWASLVRHAEHQPPLFARRNEFLLSSWQAPPNSKRDSAYTLLSLMKEAAAAGDSISARQIVGTLNSIEGLTPEELASEADVFARFGTREEQVGFADMLAQQFPNSPIALGSAGVLYLRLGDNAKCGEVLARSYLLDSANSLTALNYGIFLVNGREYSAAASVLKQALKLNPTGFLSAYYLSQTYLALGDIDNAKAATLRAEANALRPEEQQRIRQLKLRF